MAAESCRLLAFKKQKDTAAPAALGPSIGLQPQSSSRGSVYKSRLIPSGPERVLDAPDLLDDFYLNLLDWNSNNMLARAQGVGGDGAMNA